MRRISLTLAAVLAVLVLPAALSAQTRIGVVDLSRLAKETKEGRRVKARMESFMRQKQSKLDALKSRAKTLQDKLNDPKVSDAAKENAANELNQLRYELQAAASAADDEMRAKNAKEQDAFTQKALKAIKELAASMNLDFVFPTNALPYFKPSADITDQVIAKMNAMYP